MYSKTITINLEKKDDHVHWENLTDIHIGHEDFREDLFKKRLNAIVEEPMRFTSFGGDQLDGILPKGDPRFNPESVDSKLLTMSNQQDKFDDLCEPLFNEHEMFLDRYGIPKIWYMQWGNHEWNSRIIDESYMRSYCRKKRISFLGAKAMIRLNIKHDGKTLMKKDLYVAHGAGSAKSTLKALNDMSVNVNADVFMMGHLHKQTGEKQLVQYHNEKTGKWDKKRILKINGGCFTESLTLGKDSWLEHVKNEIVLAEPGTVTVTFDAYKDKIGFHM